MNPQTQHTLDAAEEAVRQLIAACRKKRPLYCQSPKHAAQVNRTAKWLLNAIANLRQAVDCSEPDKKQP